MTREEAIKELVHLNGWTEAKATEYLNSKIAVLSFQIKLESLTETLEVLREFGLSERTVTLQASVPMAWVGKLKAAMQAKYPESYYDDTVVAPSKVLN